MLLALTNQGLSLEVLMDQSLFSLIVAKDQGEVKMGSGEKKP